MHSTIPRFDRLIGLFRDRASRTQLLALFMIASLIWAFAELADEVIEGETRTLDTRILLLLRNPVDTTDPLGPPWLEELVRDVTALGGVGVLTFVVLAVAGSLWLRSKRRTTGFLFFAVGTGITLSQWMKVGFDRPRPDLVSHGSLVYTASFPSGHSLMAAVVWLTLAVLLIRTIDRWALRAYVIALAIVLVLLIGLSRIYLGVHWPTDVLAGWIVGSGWALLCATTAQWLANRGSIEKGEAD